MKSEAYIILLVITVIVIWSGSNKKLSGCYAYLAEIWCVDRWQFGQPVIWTDHKHYVHVTINYK